MAYLARTYPGKFDQLLSKFGVDVKDSHTDKYTGDRITAEEFAERNANRMHEFKQALEEQNPDESITGVIKDFTLGRFFNKNKEEEIKKRYSHLSSIEEELKNANFTAFEGGDERGFNFSTGMGGSTLEEMFREFSRKYDENISKSWDHNWKIIQGDSNSQKDINYGKTQTEKEISKALDTTLSSDSNMNLVANNVPDKAISLNEDMSKREKLTREEMVALSIVKYLPYLENIYENTKKEEEIRKIQHTPDDGKGIFDHLGDIFGGSTGLLTAGGLLLIAKKILSKIISPKRLALLGSRLATMVRFGIPGIVAFGIYSLFEEEIDGFLDSVLPDFIKDPFKNFKADWERVKESWAKGWEEFNWEDLFSWEKLTDSAAKRYHARKELEASVSNTNTKLDLKIAGESLNNLKFGTTALEPMANYLIKTQEDTKKHQEMSAEDLKKYMDSLGTKQEQTVKIFQETLEKSSMATTANVEAIISNAKLNGIIGQVVADSLSNNKETYTLDYNIALPFGRNAFGINVNNYVK